MVFLASPVRMAMRTTLALALGLISVVDARSKRLTFDPHTSSARCARLHQ